MQGLEAGQKFERYRVLRFLGSGVSGESYEAEDSTFQRKVLLKLIHPWFPLATSARRQFFREMQGISQFIHPYLATVLDYGEVKDQLYITRRFVSAGSLLSNEGRSWFSSPLPLADAINYTHQLALALQHLHNHEFVHGSLTLSNTLILRGPTPQPETDFAPFLLSDVGSAHFVRRFGFPRITLLPITAAPEQFGRRVVPESDQYALATLLYFWLASHPPFLGSPDEVMHLKHSETFPRLSSLNPSVAPEQDNILRRALSVYPEERYPSVLAFAEALLATLSQLVVTTSANGKRPEPSLHSAFETLSLPQDVPPSESALESLLASLMPLPEEAPPLAASATMAPQPVAQDEPSPRKSVSEHEPAPSEPEPRPRIAPDIPEPLPQPETTPPPAPAPEPQPETKPEPQPAPEPQPEPEVIPPPAPDIAQPIPTPQTEPEPAPLPPDEPQKEAPQPNPAPDAPDAQSTYAIIAEELLISPRLIITSPYQTESREVLLDRPIMTLGRAGSSDILLERDDLTSRHHALLRYDKDQYVIFDQKSAKGIFVNGNKIAPGVGCSLSDGDCISIGVYKLVFRCKMPQNASVPS